MKKTILVAIAAVFALAGCSDLTSNNSSKNKDLYAGGFMNSVKGLNVSAKPSSKASRANMEEIANFAQDLSRVLGYSLPSGFERLTNLTREGRSNLVFQGKFFQRLGFCEMLSVEKNPRSMKYFMVDRLPLKSQPEAPNPLPEEVYEPSTCDFDLAGGSGSGSRNIGNMSDRTADSSFLLTRKDSAPITNPVSWVEVKTYSANGSEGVQKAGQTYQTKSAKLVEMTIVLMNGDRFEMKAIRRGFKTNKQTADRANANYDKWSMIDGFYGSFDMPKGTLSYVWEVQDASDMKERFEKTMINGQAMTSDMLD